MILEYFDIIIWPLMAAFVLTGIHVYLGLHVVTRGVIFVDLALAQVAALGMAVGVLLGFDHAEGIMYFLALGFTFLGALLFSYTRSVNERVPQEAIIGITYVVSAAVMILLFSKSPEGAEHLNHLLVGSILFVTPKEVFQTFMLYAVIGGFHWRFRTEFLAVSDSQNNGKSDVNRKLWDFLFYITFGFVVTSSVKIAGVLLVFSFLIVPAIGALLFVEGISSRLIFGWIFGLVGSILGMLASLLLDIPTGAAIVVTFGFMLVIAWLFRPKGTD
jgi:zinc/manganese transport system permease protein|tara:strand:- start:80 stop:898 length:819 start_codon:yes stop_codon:yes gene_type:complete